MLSTLALYFFVVPFAILVHDLGDPGLATGRVPEFAYRWHKQLSSELEPWALGRVASRKASEMQVGDVSGTEWPIFSAVFYLWATESLQTAWEENRGPGESMPMDYASGTVKAAAELIADPGHAHWVREHWGDTYLEEENIFYRMLLISGLSTYQKLLGDPQYEDILRSQVLSLAREIDDSPTGLLDDYPGQCYPIDVLPAISSIRRADRILGTDHSQMAARAVRGFEGNALDKRTGLPAYYTNSKTGQGYGDARGVGVSYMLIWAPELWPETAHSWYSNYVKHFWREGSLVSGVREFSGIYYGDEWLVDVDAGPVIAGLGTAASAFGIGAARANGRFDQAYTLGAQALVASWPLANGSLLIPRLLSNLSDAPFVGEAALLFSFTRLPIVGGHHEHKPKLSPIVYFALVFYPLAGILIIALAFHSFRSWTGSNTRSYEVQLVEIQLGAWLSLFVVGIVCLSLGFMNAGMAFLLLAQFLPRRRQSAEQR